MLVQQSYAPQLGKMYNLTEGKVGECLVPLQEDINNPFDEDTPEKIREITRKRNSVLRFSLIQLTNYKLRWKHTQVF